jgi:hypothetical protein
MGTQVNGTFRCRGSDGRNFSLTKTSTFSGDMVDLQNSLLTTADHNVQALSEMSAAFIPREAIVEFAFSRPARMG